MNELTERVKQLPDSRKKALATELNCVSIQEASAILSVAPVTVRRMLKNGQLNGFTIGTGARGDWRINVEDIREFIRSRTQKVS